MTSRRLAMWAGCIMAAIPVTGLIVSFVYNYVVLGAFFPHKEWGFFPLVIALMPMLTICEPLIGVSSRMGDMGIFAIAAIGTLVYFCVGYFLVVAAAKLIHVFAASEGGGSAEH